MLKETNRPQEHTLGFAISANDRALRSCALRGHGQIVEAVVSECDSIHRSGAVAIDSGSLRDGPRAPDGIAVIPGTRIAPGSPVDADPDERGARRGRGSLENNVITQDGNAALRRRDSDARKCRSVVVRPSRRPKDGIARDLRPLPIGAAGVDAN